MREKGNGLRTVLIILAALAALILELSLLIGVVVNPYYWSGLSSTGYIVTLVIFYALLVAFPVITMWRIFNKAQEPGWKCLIPIYNTYVYWNIGWDGGKFWFLIGMGIVLSLLSMAMARIMGRTGMAISGIISIAWSVYTIVMTFKLGIKMAHRFGKSTLFGVLGLVFFPLIGLPILAFGKADYDGRRDI